jgi:hypothetical protein
MATKVALWELQQNRTTSPFLISIWRLTANTVPVWEPVDLSGVNPMPSLRTKSVSTKVTEEEYARLEAVAGDQTISEWARDILLKVTNPDPAVETTLAEVLALRTILLNLHFVLAQGKAMTGEDLQKLIDRADRTKLDKAHERIQEATKGKP